MNRPIRVGHIDLSFHDASAREVEAILARHGHTVERSAAPHEEMFRRLGANEIDILVAAWLPKSHGAYLAPMVNDVLFVTVLYTPYCIWGVPEYVPASDVPSVKSLLRVPALDRMERLIQGINPGAGISRFSKAIMEHYGLTAAGYHFETGTEAQCFGTFEQAVKEQRWIVIPLWHPQYLHHRYHIRALAEPDGLLGGTDQATLIVHKNAESEIGASALAELGELKLGNALVSELDDRIQLTNKPEGEKS